MEVRWKILELEKKNEIRNPMETMETCNSFANLRLACHRFKWEPFLYERSFNKIPFGSPGAGFTKGSYQPGSCGLDRIPQINDRFTVAFSEAIFLLSDETFRLHFGRKKLGLNPLKMLHVEF